MACYLTKTEDADTVTYQTPDGTRFRFNKQDSGRFKGLVEHLYELERQNSKEGIEMTDRCVACGAPVPEGQMVCWTCIHSQKDVQTREGKMIEGIRIPGVKFVRSEEEPNTKYMELPDGLRLIFRNGTYDGYYDPNLPKGVF